MKNKFSLFSLFLALLFLLFTQFYKLGELPIIQWDESRLAVNAAEMSLSNQYLVTTFENKPDLYNTKPPLMIWLQVLSIRCFGLNEWAIRLPSALAGLMTILLVGLFVYRLKSNRMDSAMAMLILTASDGFIQLHGSMTGDYDALLTFFLVLSIFHCYLFLQNKKRWYMLLFALDVSLALMTKSAAALIFFPIYAVLFYNDSKFIYMGRLAGVLLIAFVPNVLFVVLRENAAPGYLEAMWENDIGGRFLHGKDGHEGPWYYYLYQLFTFRYNLLVWLLPFAIGWGIYKKNNAINFISIILIIFLLVISVAKTKLEWYDLPALPLIAILIALFAADFYNAYHAVFYGKMFMALIIIVLTWSIYEKFNFTFSGKNRRLDMNIYTISNHIRTYRGPDILYYYSGDYDAWNYFYTLSNPFVKRADYNRLNTGDKMISTHSFADSVKIKFQTITIDSNAHDQTIQIAGVR